MKITRVFYALLISCCFMVFPNYAISSELPANWPWRGVTLNNLETNPEDVKMLKEKLGINSIRITLKVRHLAALQKISSTEALNRTIKWADAVLDTCREVGVAGIISVSEFPMDPSLGLTQDSPDFWGNARLLTDAVKTAGRLADHFRSRGKELAAYEFFNEPLLKEDRKQILPPSYERLRKDIVSEIRKYDAKRWIVITPGLGGLPAGYRGYKPLEDPYIVYGAHMYQPHPFTHQGINERKVGVTYPGVINGRNWDKKQLKSVLEPLREFQVKYGVPVWIGEFSAARWAEGGERYLVDLVEVFNSYGWGWAVFNFKGYHAWNPDYDTVYRSDKPDDWKKSFLGDTSTRWKTLKKLFKLP